MVGLPLYWLMDCGGIYDTRNNSNGGGDSIIKNPVGAFITGSIGAPSKVRINYNIIGAPAGTRISTAGGYSREPSAEQGAWEADPKLRSGWKEREAKEKKKKAKAIKWAKRRKAIKELLHKIKEKLKE